MNDGLREGFSTEKARKRSMSGLLTQNVYQCDDAQHLSFGSGEDKPAPVNLSAAQKLALIKPRVTRKLFPNIDKLGYSTSTENFINIQHVTTDIWVRASISADSGILNIYYTFDGIDWNISTPSRSTTFFQAFPIDLLWTGSQLIVIGCLSSNNTICYYTAPADPGSSLGPLLGPKTISVGSGRRVFGCGRLGLFKDSCLIPINTGTASYIARCALPMTASSGVSSIAGYNTVGHSIMTSYPPANGLLSAYTGLEFDGLSMSGGITSVAGDTHGATSWNNTNTIGSAYISTAGYISNYSPQADVPLIFKSSVKTHENNVMFDIPTSPAFIRDSTTNGITYDNIIPSFSGRYKPQSLINIAKADTSLGTIYMYDDYVSFDMKEWYTFNFVNETFGIANNPSKMVTREYDSFAFKGKLMQCLKSYRDQTFNTQSYRVIEFDQSTSLSLRPISVGYSLNQSKYYTGMVL